MTGSAFAKQLRRLPLVAILRGLTPGEAPEIGRALVHNGFGLIEAPLNSPEPLVSIRRLADELGADALVGAGTVLDAQGVRPIAEAGGRLIVAPNFDADVVRAAREHGLIAMPGVATPTEAFAALKAGAAALKLFPAEMITPAAVKALRAVLPRDALLLPVGGITPENMGAYLDAGANGFGIGAALYKPGMTVQAVGAAAKLFAEAYRAHVGGAVSYPPRPGL